MAEPIITISGRVLVELEGREPVEVATLALPVRIVGAEPEREPLPALLGAAPLMPEPGTEISTAAQFAAWWNEQTDEHREEAYERIHDWQKRSSACFMEAHDRKVEQLQRLLEDAALSETTRVDVSRETLLKPAGYWVETVLGQSLKANGHVHARELDGGLLGSVCSCGSRWIDA